MGADDQRDRGVGRLGALAGERGVVGLDQLPDLVRRLAPVLVGGEDLRADGPGQGDQLERPAFGPDRVVLAAKRGLREHLHSAVEDPEDVHRRGLAEADRVVVVAHDHGDRDACLQHRAERLGELALLGRRGVGGAVGVAREQEQVHVLRDGARREHVEGPAEVEQPCVEAGRRVEAAVRLVAEVEVGTVEDLHVRRLRLRG